jgi:hypothetical protein
MNHAAAQERQKYPEELVPPEEDEIFIPDRTVKRIAKTVESYKTIPGVYRRASLSEEERKPPYWRDSFEAYKRAWPNYGRIECMDLLRTLILHGEMEPLLRLAAHANIRLPSIYAFVEDGYDDFGWSDIKNSMLMAYIGLNMFLVKPELYDPASRSQKLDEMKKKYGLAYTPEMFDYRNTSAYQKILTHLYVVPRHKPRLV